MTAPDQQRCGGSGECPTCGSDDPRFVDAAHPTKGDVRRYVWFSEAEARESRRPHWHCPDPFHTPEKQPTEQAEGERCTCDQFSRWAGATPQEPEPDPDCPLHGAPTPPPDPPFDSDEQHSPAPVPPQEGGRWTIKRVNASLSAGHAEQAVQGPETDWIEVVRASSPNHRQGGQR